MSYQVLARKWRPQSFSDLVGLESTVQILSNALNQNRLHHAYLFTGTRGVGKTTLARIIAKCLNCVQGVTSNPCGTCIRCQAIQQGQCMDLYEVDAASRTKVEDMRSLLENIHYPPSQGRFKIYLIDEIHMLSNHSFNALLKTLEEPPAHVVFLFATTEPKRIPVTVLSRCLQFHLKNIPETQISSRLETVCAAENIFHEKEALQLIAQEADGSLRDALSLLDQAIAYAYSDQHAPTTLTADGVSSMLGVASQQTILPLLQALANYDSASLQTLVAELSQKGLQADSILKEFIVCLHQLTMHKMQPERYPHLQPLAQSFSEEALQLYYQMALMGRRDLTYAPTPWLGLEMTLFRLLAFTPFQLDETLPPSPAPAIPKPVTLPPKAEASIPAPLPEKSSAPVSTCLPLNQVNWPHIINALALSGMTQALAAQCAFHACDETTLTLQLAKSHVPMLSDKIRLRFQQALSEYYQKTYTVNIVISTAAFDHTPDQQKRHQEQQHLSDLKQHFSNHPHIQSLIKTFDAELEVSLK